MRRIPLALLAALALVAAACGGDDDGERAGPEQTTTTTTGTTAGPGSTSTTAATSTTVSTTTRPDGSSTARWQRCENPAGFSISYPAGWSVNDGSVVNRCSKFDPEPFAVPEGTDERVAAVNVRVENVPFHEVATPGEGDRHATTAVDGHQAVRAVGPAGALFGEDTERTRYAVDLALGVDDGPGTLFADVPDLAGIDYERAVTVLDRMVRTIELTAGDEAPEDRVARYEGAAPFSAELTVRDGEPCLTTPTRGEPSTTCFAPPGPDELRFADYSGDLFSAFGGVVGSDVFRVTVDTGSGSVSFLPVDTDAQGARGWVVPVDGASVRTLKWYGHDGSQLGARRLDGGDGS